MVSLEYLDQPGLADCYVEMPPFPVEEDHIGNPGKLSLGPHRARPGIKDDECLAVARAEQALSRPIQVQPMGAGSWDGKGTGHEAGVRRLDDQDLRGIGDVDVEPARLPVKDHPASSARHGDVHDHLPSRHVDQ